MYVPYIASGMLDEEDKTYFNVKGVQINDPSINYDGTMMQGMNEIWERLQSYTDDSKPPLCLPCCTTRMVCFLKITRNAQ